MAVFTEVIKLVDEVSAPAKAAGAAVLNFGQRMALLRQKSALAKAATEGLGAATKKTAFDFEKASKAIADIFGKGDQRSSVQKKFDAESVKSTKLAEKDKASAVRDATQKQIADQTKMANTLSVVKDSVGSAVQGMKSAFISLAAGDVKGAIAGVTDSVAGMAKMLDLVVPGLGEAVAAVIQIAGGLVGITVGLIKSGIEFAIASNQGKQAMLSMFDAMGDGAVKGAELDDMLSGLSDEIGITKDSLIPLTKGFIQMGTTGKEELERLTLAAISANAIVGKGGAEAFTNIQKKIALAAEAGGKFQLSTKQLLQLRDAGVGVSDIAAKMGMKTEALAAALGDGTVDAKKFGEAMTEAVIKKGAGPLDRLGSSFEEIKKKFMSSIGDMFEDIDVGPFMKEVKDLFAIFSAAPASGQAMKAGIGGFFKEVFSSLTKVVPMVKHFLLDMVIYGLKAYIAIKPIAKAIQDFAKSATGAATINTVLSSLLTVLKAVGVVILVVAAGALALWAAMIVVSTTVWTLVGLFTSLWVDGFMAGITAMANVNAAIVAFVTSAWETLTGWVTGAATAASDFVAGLVGGITAGAGAVIGAVTGLAGKATGAFKSALGIASPSKVMAGFGEHMGGGVVQGLETSESDVHGASSGVADAAVKGMAKGGEGASAGGAGGKGGNVINVTVTIDGAGKSAEQITQELVANVFEQMALQGAA